MNKLTTQTEPLRIYYGLATLVAAVYLPVSVYLASKGYPMESALVAGIGTALFGGAVTEGKRAVTDSPATREGQTLAIVAESLAPVDKTPLLTARLQAQAAPVLGGDVAEANATSKPVQPLDPRPEDGPQP